MSGGQIRTSSLGIGDVLEGRFKILKRIATGGTGSVYVADDLKQPEVKAAVKVLHPSHFNDQSLVARFVQEATLLNSIDHVNIVKTKDIHVSPDLIFLATEYIVGQTLGEIIESSDRPFEIIPAVVEQVCQGLKVVHSHGILHRDLKPENIIMQSDGLIKIIDFGAARSPKSQLTLAGQMVGTTPYIAPEVWIEKRLTPAIDFYSLGVILYQITTKELPFETLRTSDLMRLHLRADPVAPSQRVPTIPDWLDFLILKLLAKKPVRRFQDADQIIEFLHKVKTEGFSPSSRTTFKAIKPDISKRKVKAKKSREGLFTRLVSRVLGRKKKH